jgi:hypothetical protein
MALLSEIRAPGFGTGRFRASGDSRVGCGCSRGLRRGGPCPARQETRGSSPERLPSYGRVKALLLLRRLLCRPLFRPAQRLRDLRHAGQQSTALRPRGQANRTGCAGPNEGQQSSLATCVWMITRRPAVTEATLRTLAAPLVRLLLQPTHPPAPPLGVSRRRAARATLAERPQDR